MYSQHSCLRSTRPLIAVMVRVLAESSAVSAFWGMPACAPQDNRGSDELTEPEVQISHHTTAAETSPYTLFESGQVRPLSLSPDKRHLFATNTPDNRLEIFEIRNTGLIHQASIPVGLEPVAVAARTDHEV